MNSKYIFFLIVTALVIFWGFASPWRVSGDCMEPAVKDGQRYFVDRISPYIRQYQLYDIVIFNYENIVWVSRIVALENDTIQIEDGRIIVNDVAQDDTKIKRNWSNWNHGSYAINESFKVPVGHVYVLSDNLSADHDDSRVFGPISKKEILGVVW